MSLEELLANCHDICLRCPCLNGSELFSYGTAGFRIPAKHMPFICTRIGLVAALRALCRDATIGVVLTASHNPWTDNGVKLIDPDGSMLEETWESISIDIVNCSDVKTAVARVIENMDEQSRRKLLGRLSGTADLSSPYHRPHSNVIVGYDTRMNNPALAEIIGKSCKALGVQFKNFGFLTTPQVHYITYAENAVQFARCCDPPGEDGYYKKFGLAYFRTMSQLPLESDRKLAAVVDTANGIGGPKLAALLDFLTSVGIEHDVRIVNNNAMDVVRSGAGGDASEESRLTPLFQSLNCGCGSDYVKTNLVVPDGFRQAVNNNSAHHCVAFDGDADRIVYFTATDKMLLLDGDRIAVLCAMYINDLILRIDSDYVPTVGVVQTAYSNGNCTKFIKERLNMPVVITHTGVKNLHREAKQFDIGVYFEANGHGTVLFSEDTISRLRYLSAFASNLRNCKVYSAMLNFSELINQTVGDAMTTFLAVEFMLKYFKINLQQWYDLYNDLPNKLMKWPSENGKTPKNELLLVCGPECQCVEPEGLSMEIGLLVEAHEQHNARAFVRKSGTERILRIYVEATREAVVDKIAKNIVSLLEEYIGYTEL